MVLDQMKDFQDQELAKLDTKLWDNEESILKVKHLWLFFAKKCILSLILQLTMRSIESKTSPRPLMALPNRSITLGKVSIFLKQRIQQVTVFLEVLSQS